VIKNDKLGVEHIEQIAQVNGFTPKSVGPDSYESGISLWAEKLQVASQSGKTAVLIRAAKFFAKRRSEATVITTQPPTQPNPTPKKHEVNLADLMLKPASRSKKVSMADLT